MGVAASAAYLAAPTWRGWADDTGPHALIVGTTTGLAFWLLASCFCVRYALPESSNPAAYKQLTGEYTRIRARVGATAIVGDPSHAEATAELDEAGIELGLTEPSDPSSDWMLATGYPAVWNRLHRADECLFDLECAAMVIGYALYDELRLLGARIPEKEELLSKLRIAVVALEPAAGRYLYQAIALPVSAPGRVLRSMQGSGSADKGVHLRVRGHVVLGAQRECLPRAALRQVRHSINEYRDDRREGLVRARNNLFTTVLYTGITAYLVLALALMESVSRSVLAAALTYYLVGATVGLFRHLRSASARDAIIEDDYGLSTVRLLQLPLFCGIAGVAGVALTALLPALVPTLHGRATQVPAAAEIYNLGENPTYLVIAAVFGLTPNLLIRRLDQQAESYKADLKSSEAAEHHRP
jgi:hypothetical protein